MTRVNFYLKKPKGHISLIVLHFWYGGDKLVFSTGQSVHAKDWNSEKQRVKSNTKTISDGKHLLNNLLDNLQRVCIKAYNLEIQNGKPEQSVLRKYLTDFINQ